MTARPRAVLVAAVAALVTATLYAAPAYADDVTLTDPADATGSLSDIRKVTVRHNVARLTFKIRFTDLRPASDAGPSSAQIYVDTDSSRNGPEFVLGTGLQSGTDYQLARVRGWDGGVGHPSSCPHRLRLDFAANQLRGWIARRCVQTPERLRVAIEMNDNYDGSHPITDWLKGPHKWTRWLAAG